jgi:hypothetical protein
MTVIADTIREKINETRVQTLVKSWLAADDVFRIPSEHPRHIF